MMNNHRIYPMNGANKHSFNSLSFFSIKFGIDSC